MYKSSLYYKFFFLSIITPFLFIISGCMNKVIGRNESLYDNEVPTQILGVAALGKLNPIGDV